MPNSSYSVLFMRDDADVKTLRVSPRRLKLLLWALLCLLVLVVIGLIIGLRSFVGYRSLLGERRALEVRLAELQVDLERLGNLEKIQKSGPAPTGKEAQKNRVAETAPAAAQAFHLINSGIIDVENFKVQMQGANIAISFDLNNRAKNPASGSIRLLLLRNNGSLTELTPSTVSDLTYQIQRFKRISVNAPVPAGLTRREALGLRVEIKNSDGEVILGEIYALGN
jgi:hypothetical protein